MFTFFFCMAVVLACLGRGCCFFCRNCISDVGYKEFRMPGRVTAVVSTFRLRLSELVIHPHAMLLTFRPDEGERLLQSPRFANLMATFHQNCGTAEFQGQPQVAYVRLWIRHFRGHSRLHESFTEEKLTSYMSCGVYAPLCPSSLHRLSQVFSASASLAYRQSN